MTIMTLKARKPFQQKHALDANQSRYMDDYYSTDVDGGGWGLDNRSDIRTLTPVMSEFSLHSTASRDTLASRHGTASHVDDDHDDEDEEEMNEDNAFGYEYQRYLSGSKVLNCFLALWHLVILVMGVSLVLCGTVLKYQYGELVVNQVKALPNFSEYTHFIHVADEKQKIDFTSYPEEIGMMLISINGAYSAGVLLYMTYSFHTIQFTLPIATLVGAVGAFAEITIVNVLFAPTIIMEDHVVDELMEKANSTYAVMSDNQFSISFDYISTWFQCCGITNQFDFQTTTLSYQQPGHTHKFMVQVPPTCCRRDRFASGMNQVIACATNSENVNPTGCFTALVNYIQECGKYYSIIIWIHLADIGIHAMLYRQRVSFLARVLEYKSQRQDDYMKFLMKRRLKAEDSEMQHLFGPRKANSAYGLGKTNSAYGLGHANSALALSQTNSAFSLGQTNSAFGTGKKKSRRERDYFG